MSLEAYANPDFGWPEKLVFLLAVLAGIMICILLIMGSVRISLSSMSASERRMAYRDRALDRIHCFYELIIAGTSVLSFSCAYVIINHIYSRVASGAVASTPMLDLLTNAWANGRDFILLLLICLSCVLNSLLDSFLIPIRRLEKEEKATMRMLAMFYCIFILIYLNRIGDESEYNPVMMYYLGLMVGRFVYFDASFADFAAALKKMFLNLPLLIITLALTGTLSWFGFSAGYLLERNYYIVGIFYVHLFMLAVVFMLRVTHLPELILPHPADRDLPEE